MSSRLRLALFLPSLLTFIIVAACNKDDSHPPVSSSGGNITVPLGGTTEGGTTEDDSGDVIDTGILPDGGACNLVEFTGGLIQENGLDEDPPTPLGGTITNGTYTLIDYEVYNGVGGTTAGPTDTSMEATMIISGGFLVDRIQEIQTTGTGTTTETIESSYLAAGNMLTFQDTCPTATTETYGYTVSPPTLVLTNLLTKEVFTYTEQ